MGRLFVKSNAQVLTSDSVISDLDVGDLERTELEIQPLTQNLTAFKIYSRCHKNANWLPMLTTSNDFASTGSFLLAVNINPFSLVAGAYSVLMLNTAGKYQLRLIAQAASAGILNLYGWGE